MASKKEEGRQVGGGGRGMPVLCVVNSDSYGVTSREAWLCLPRGKDSVFGQGRRRRRRRKKRKGGRTACTPPAPLPCLLTAA